MTVAVARKLGFLKYDLILFLKRGVMFLLGCIACCILLNISLPERPYWGNMSYEKKLTQFKQRDYNTVFFGSSRVLTGINPLFFDSLVNQTRQGNMRSYNLATAGTWANETFYLYDRFLADTTLHSNIDVAFMEFQNIMGIRSDKLNSDKVIYYQNTDNLLFIYSYATEQVLLDANNAGSSLAISTAYSIATLEKYLNIGRLRIPNDFHPDSTEMGDERGYMDLSARMKNQKTITNKEIQGYKTSIDKFGSGKETKINNYFYQRVTDLIDRSKQRGIHLIFILPPVKLTSGMMAVYQKLPSQNKIDLIDYKKYPELYDTANWIDATHLNNNGSRILNEHLSVAYEDLRETLSSN